MSESFEFRDHEGETKLSSDERAGLKLKHIMTMRELDEAEALNIMEALEFLRRYQKKNYFELEFAVKLHRKMFHHVWSWAGVLRSTEKNIGVSPFKVAVELKKLLDDMKAWIEFKSYPPIEMVARLHHRLVWIHPFPNGNGRWARIYTEYICRRESWPKPNWHASEDPHERRVQYIAALRAADLKNYGPLIQFLSL